MVYSCQEPKVYISDWSRFFSNTANTFDLAILLADTDWSYSHEHSQLEEDFAKVSAQARADEFKKMSKALAVSLLVQNIA